MKNVLFVGLNPGKSPRIGSTFKRFGAWLDYMGLNIVSFTNVSSDPNWDLRFSSLDTSFLKESLSGYDKYVAWGNVASQILRKLDVEHFVLPHPSGLNRQINDHKYIEHKLTECRKYINNE